MRCWDKRAAEAPPVAAEGFSLNIDFSDSLFFTKTVGRINESKEISSVRLF